MVVEFRPELFFEITECTWSKLKTLALAAGATVLSMKEEFFFHQTLTMIAATETLLATLFPQSGSMITPDIKSNM